ncbi:MAG: mannosyl-3-phosphoglycerate phosphatase [Candidatus Diapherotrites archaeon CG11_big_fil_rev_8_21_14_0_20_37_9]|nr:MAG: mannosyl-3-phosphoglycerate phosphatase [Candidatus Diapherotrites archaeon CG11_big_fil_rev_8_21_14_0_20_37_9]
MKIIFTDLDSTLLDHETYSFKDAQEAIKQVKAKKIPIIIVSSKTRAEIEEWQKRIGIKDPFVCENGAAIFFPEKYFSKNIIGAEKEGKYYAIKFSPGINEIRKGISKIRENGFEIKCLNEMSLEEVCKITNLDKNMAALAREREFEECFVSEADSKELENEIKSIGFEYTKGGRFHHIMKNHSKGKAVKKLVEIFRIEFGNVKSIAVGDSTNDFGMLKAADNGYLVMRPDGSYASDVFLKAKGIGPKGWAYAVKEFIKQ